MTQQQPRRRGRIALLVALAVAIALADQVTKYLAEERLTQGVYVPLVGDLLGWQLIYNPGAAFSFATGMTWVFTLISVVVVVVVVRVSRRLRSAAWAVALGMLLGGAVGNLYDRLLREPGFARGRVVDFINYNGWFVGNVADIAIVGAAVLIAVLALLGIEVDGTRATDAAPVDADDTADVDDEDVSEEPLAAEGEFSAEVPRASDADGVDVAAWAAAAPSASAAPASVLADDDETAPSTATPAGPRTGPTGSAERAPDAAEDAPERPRTSTAAPNAAQTPADAPEQSASAADPAPADAAPALPARRRPRSRREARLAEDDA